jgi:ketosteroid isomerase-like protein
MKQLLTILVIFLISSVLFVACGDKTASTTEEIKPTFDLAGAKKVIDSTNAVFGSMVSKGDSVGLAPLYTSDAKFMMPNAPTVSGRSAIQSAFAGLFAAMGTPGLTLTTTDIWGSDELITEVGTFTMTDKSGKEIDKGKYVDLWKMEDGKWKLHRDIFNSDLPPMAPSK